MHVLLDGVGRFPHRRAGPGLQHVVGGLLAEVPHQAGQFEGRRHGLLRDAGRIPAVEVAVGDDRLQGCGHEVVCQGRDGGGLGSDGRDLGERRFLLRLFFLRFLRGLAAAKTGTHHVSQAGKLPDLEQSSHPEEGGSDQAAAYAESQQRPQFPSGEGAGDPARQEPGDHRSAARPDSEAGDVHQEIAAIQAG